MTTTTGPAQRLQLIQRHWNDLHQLRTTRPHDAWPPPSLHTYLRTIEEYDPTDRSAPVRLHVIDTLRLVEAALVECADQIAAVNQRPVMGLLPEGYPKADRRRRELLVMQDRNDPRRWKWTGSRPNAPYAALWLLARLQGAPGPFRPLRDDQRQHVASVAAGAAERVEHALGITRRATPTGHTCACGGQLILHGGDGQPPAVECEQCRARIGETAAA